MPHQGGQGPLEGVYRQSIDDYWGKSTLSEV